jgi:exodeoxyribonuclease-5
MRQTQILRTRSDIAEIIRNSPSEDEVFNKLSSPPARPEIENRLDKIESKLEAFSEQVGAFSEQISGIEAGLAQLLLIAKGKEAPAPAAPAPKPVPEPVPELRIKPTTAAYCPENADVNEFVKDVIQTLKKFEINAAYSGYNSFEKAWIIDVEKPLSSKAFGGLSIQPIADIEEDEVVAGTIAIRHDGDGLNAYGLYTWDGDDFDTFITLGDGEEIAAALEELDRTEGKEKGKPKLTPSQESAIATLKTWFNEGTEKEAALIGPAGTGKSFSLKALIEEMELEPKEIALLAPTHKARKILESFMGSDASTIAQALGQQPKLDENGQEVFEGKGDKCSAKLTIIDEASMVSAEDYSELVSLNDRILWVGDRYQLPPVKEKKSMAFESPSVLAKPELTEVVRYEGAIAEFCERLRHGDLTLPIPDNETLFLLDKKEWKKRAIEFAKSPKGLENTSYTKVLAFRNRTVNAHNKTIKKAVFPKQKDPYFEGLKLICNSPIQRLEYVSIGRGRWQKEELLWSIKATNSEELLITSKPTTKTLTLDDFEEEPKIFTEWVAGWQIWEFEAQTEGFLDITCRVLTPEFEEAKENKIKELGGNNYKLLSYGEKEAMKCLYRYFDKVGDTFSITTHKAQGSGYDNVFIDWPDLISARDMRQQLIYTACTRARKRLFIAKN